MARGIALLSAALAATAASGQRPDLCSCSPTSFEFTLDLSGTCGDNTVNGNPGIIGSFCFLESVQEAEVEAAAAAPAEEEAAEVVSAEAVEVEAVEVGLVEVETGEVVTVEAAPAEGEAKAAPDSMYHELAWGDIPDDVRAAYVALGYDEAYWNGEGEDPPAAAMAWMELTADEQEAATILGYDEASWDGASSAPEQASAADVVATTAAATRPPATRPPATRPPLGGAGEADGTTTPTLTTEAVRLLQDEPGQVVEVVSVQFLEFDNSGDLTVINQDDTYVDTSLSDGDTVKFYSASSMLDTSLPLAGQQSSPALVPGGASLILYGRTADGSVVRNRFFWLYDMSCGDENAPVEVGDQIAWATVSGTANAWPAFCPALPEGSPTMSPRTTEPTLTPSKAPVLADVPVPVLTDAPVASTGAPTLSGGWGPDQGPAFQGSKGGKAAKGHVGPGYHPSDKSGKAKSSKDAKYAKAYGEVAAKSDKSHKSNKSSKGHGYYNTFRDSSFLAQRANGAAGARSYSLIVMISCLWIATRQ
mmetsp:Transcript_38403/g.86481  ORF Transcript_38403/g.86481 Transcript_38403/m.86481 type:complete len:533 (+) Transcript_38403:81-1679(+)